MHGLWVQGTIDLAFSNQKPGITSNLKKYVHFVHNRDGGDRIASRMVGPGMNRWDIAIYDDMLRYVLHIDCLSRPPSSRSSSKRIRS